MKKILITGVNSYIGTNVKEYLQKYNLQQGKECYQIECISQREESWKNHDFSAYDTVLDVTGIAHADIGRVSEEEKKRYYQINCDLAVMTAEKARKEGVRQFIYLSSIIVYGESAPVGKTKHITKDTVPAPANFYGDSKWQAEQQLRALGDEQFHVAILRPPFIYGAGSKGNYPILSKLAKILPVFPTIRNERSMLYIENLCEFLRLLVEAGDGGLFFPQNAEYSTTAEMVQAIGAANEKRIYLCKSLNPLVKLMSGCPNKIGRLTNKAFGSLTYDLSMSDTFEGYRLYNLQDSICRTEQRGKA